MAYPYLSFAFRAFFTFLPFLYFARVLSEDDYAIITFCYTIFVLTSSISEFGFTFLGFKNASIEWNYLKQVNLLKLKFIFSIFAALGVAIYAYFSGLIPHTDSFVLLVFVISGVLNSFGLHISSLFRGLECFKIDFLYNLVKACCLVLPLLVVSDLDVESIGFSYLLCTLLSLLVISFKLLSLRPVNESTSESLGIALKSDKSGILVYGLQTVLVIGYMQLDAQIVAFHLGAAEMSRYLDITRIIIGASMAGEVLVMRSIPGYIRSFTGTEAVNAKAQVFSWLFIVVSILFLVTDSLGFNFFELIYGSRGEKIDSSNTLIVIFIVYLRTLGIIPSTLLSSSKSKEKRILFLAITLSVSLLLNSVLIPIYGFSAALFVLLTVNSLLAVIYLCYMQWKYNVRAFGLLELANVLLMLLFYVFSSGLLFG